VLTSEEVLRKEGVDPAWFENGARIHCDSLNWWLSKNSRPGGLTICEAGPIVFGVPGPSSLFHVTDKEGNFATVEAETLTEFGIR
jgi:hypothetical protein